MLVCGQNGLVGSGDLGLRPSQNPLDQCLKGGGNGAPNFREFICPAKPIRPGLVFADVCEVKILLGQDTESGQKWQHVPLVKILIWQRRLQIYTTYLMGGTQKMMSDESNENERCSVAALCGQNRHGCRVVLGSTFVLG